VQADESEGVLVFETSGVFALENVRAATSTANTTSGVPSVLVALCVRKHSMQVRLSAFRPFGWSLFLLRARAPCRSLHPCMYIEMHFVVVRV
jgi:hypothetical protein